MKYCFFVCCFTYLSGFSQVGINTKYPKATLDVAVSSTNNNAEGIIAPRLSRLQVIERDDLYGLDQTGTILYVESIGSEILTEKTNKINSIGYYFFDGNFWSPLTGNKEPLYLPSFNLPLLSIQNNVTFDLYNEVYKKQFTKAGNSLFFSSNPDLLQIPVIYNSDQIDYVVTYFDPNYITINSISSAGVINYNVISTNPTTNSFINIVLIVK